MIILWKGCDDLKKESLKMFVGGGIIGLMGVLLVTLGNPGNMGICVACFWRDIAGALGLHRAEVVQYIRPEIIGFIFGAAAISMITGDFKARGGSSPALRFVMGVFMAIGALVFLGCPLRMILRLGNGDLNALVGLAGFIVGIVVGIQFLKRGYTLGKSVKESKVVGLVMPAFGVMLLVLLLVKPEFIFFSQEGPGATHAPMYWSLAAGIVAGIILQRTRICSAGAIRDVILIKNFHFLWGILGIFVVTLISNLVLNGGINIGFADQPIAHNNHLWNFLGMTLVGLTGILLGGCPIRQTILASEGDGDAAITIFGLLVGAAFAHNFNLASSGKGSTPNGEIATIIGLVVCLAAAFWIISRKNKERMES